jgi:hypothetical protein
MQTRWIPRLALAIFPVLALAMVPVLVPPAGAEAPSAPHHSVGAAPLVLRAMSASAARTSVQPTAVACSGTQLTPHVMVGLGGAGHWSSLIVVRNAGKVPCLVRGYPAVRIAVSARAPSAEVAETPRGFTGGLPLGASPPTVVLRVGETASAIMEGTDVPTGTATTCPTYPSYAIIVPGQRRAVTIDEAIENCSGVAVHPFVVGFNGSFPTGQVVGRAPACALRTKSGSVGPMVQIDAWSGSHLAASETIFPGAKTTSHYQLVLKPGAYRIDSAHDTSSLRVVVQAGRTVSVGSYGRCAQAGPFPTTAPAGADSTTSTTRP